MPKIKVGVQVAPQHTTYADYAQAWLDADARGVDSIWNWDHFFPLSGDPDGPHFEGWTTLAAIGPQWIPGIAGHLLKKQLLEPHWEKKQGAVVAYERVTLYGVPIIAKRRVQFSRIDPAYAPELFIRHALVGGEWDSHHRFVADNARLVEEVAELEDRVRRRDLVVDDEVLVEFFEQRIPAEATDMRAFDRWWKTARRSSPDLLTYPRELLVRGFVRDVTDRIRIIRRLDFTKQARIDATYDEHAKILKAIQRKRGDQAAMLLRAIAERNIPDRVSPGVLSWVEDLRRAARIELAFHELLQVGRAAPPVVTPGFHEPNGHELLSSLQSTPNHSAP